MMNETLFYSAESSSLLKGQYMIIKNNPCKIVDISTSNPGKHGHSKNHFVGIDIFTGKKLEDICPSSHNVNIPIVEKNKYILTYIDDDDYLSLMSIESKGIKSDLRLSGDNMDQNIKKEYIKNIDTNKEIILTIISSMNKEKIVDFVVK